MGIAVIKGVREDGIFDTEFKSTAVLITELIREYPKLCEMEVYHRLCEIRESAERDDRVRATYVSVLKSNKEDGDDKQREGEGTVQEENREVPGGDDEGRTPLHD